MPKSEAEIVAEQEASLAAMGLTTDEIRIVANISTRACIDAAMRGGPRRGFLLQKGVAFAIAKAVVEVEQKSSPARM